MEKDTIITLDDKTTYALMDEIEFDEKQYFFALKIDEETNNPTTEYEIFEIIKENNETYIEIVEDEIRETIFLEFTTKYINETK